MYMPVMDHRIVANLDLGESGWIVDRAFQNNLPEDEGICTLNGSAHLYPKRSVGVNTNVIRVEGAYFVKYYAPGANGYYPFIVSDEDLTEVTPVNITLEDNNVRVSSPGGGTR